MNSALSNLKNKKILITGGLGFIGSNIAQQAVRLGGQVTIFDACLEPYGWNPANIKEIEKEVRLVRGDIRDYDALAEQVKAHEIIFHMAAQVGREISMSDPQLDTDINCTGTLNLCRAIEKLNREVKVVYAGSRGQIGEPVYLPVDENHPTLPTDIYGINKLAAEKYLLLYGKVYGFPAVSLRLNNVYGPRCQMHHGFYGILNWFIRNAMEEKPITVYGDGLQTRDYVYVDDVVQAFLLAAATPAADGNIYMIGSGVESRFLDMVKEVIAAVGRGSYVHVPFPPERESIDIRKFVITYAAMQKDTSWTPLVDLKTGVEKTVAFYKERLAEYLAV
jgi:nucleoside-diphosphate-sugar epimerase